ncbi:MAG TPA: NAD(P)/FAD-dependent oxidoreductase [Steroidobacteraceae bacterium]|nr:NAD(P)/FAD-dependent oxidoreductase [Steroidobacteraceae bacterium]
MEATQVVVVGAGIVGLAIARALARQGLETLVLEQHPRPGQETTSRNSGVIHSGIYYPTGSLKARSCVRGRTMLYEFCERRGVAYQRCGKLIVATEAQVAGLRVLEQRALANGVTDLVRLDAAQVAKLEPEVRCATGLLSPSTGIVDVHALVLTLLGDLEAASGALVLQSTLQRARRVDDGIVIEVTSAGTASELRCRWLINCAGLGAVDLLARIEGYPVQRRRPVWYAKGSYFTCHGVRPFRRLLYPMPNDAGLGIHATLDFDGTTRFGPDVEWVERPDYRVDPQRAGAFYAAIREYWPTIPAGSLQPAYAGVRPKLVVPGAASADFEIEGPAQHAVPGLINLLGFESPGLTAALAIGELVAGQVSTA